MKKFQRKFGERPKGFETFFAHLEYPLSVYLENAQRALKHLARDSNRFSRLIWRTPKGLWNLLRIMSVKMRKNIWRTPKGLWNYIWYVCFVYKWQIWRTPKGLWNTPTFLPMHLTSLIWRTPKGLWNKILGFVAPLHGLIWRTPKGLWNSFGFSSISCIFLAFGERPKGFETKKIIFCYNSRVYLENAQRALKPSAFCFSLALVYLENAQRALKHLLIKNSWSANSIWRTPKGLWNPQYCVGYSTICKFGERPKGFETYYY